MSLFGTRETVREISAPPPPPPATPPEPAAPATRAQAATDPITASRATNATGRAPAGAGTVAGSRSLVNTSSEGLTRKAETRKRSLLGGV